MTGTFATTVLLHLLPTGHRFSLFPVSYSNISAQTTSYLFSLFFVFGCGGSDNGSEQYPKSPVRTAFTDITLRSKLDFIHNPGIDGSYWMPESIGSGGAFLDYDNDDDLDIYLVNGSWHGVTDNNNAPLKNHLFRQEDDGTFVDVTESSGLGDQGYGIGVAVGDIDNDGDVDVYVSRWEASLMASYARTTGVSCCKR